MKKIKIIFLIFIAAAASCFSNELISSKQIFYDMIRIRPALRDKQAGSLINSIVSLKGKVISLDTLNRYNRPYRIIVEDDLSVKNKLELRYYIFIENKDTWSQFLINEKYDFSGQITAYTPARSDRSSYIFDLVFYKAELPSNQ